MNTPPSPNPLPTIDSLNNIDVSILGHFIIQEILLSIIEYSWLFLFQECF